MAWLLLITQQTQTAKKVLRLALPQSHIRLRMAAGSLRVARSYFPVSFCAAIWPATPSLSASRTLAQSARAWSCLPSAA